MTGLSPRASTTSFAGSEPLALAARLIAVRRSVRHLLVRTQGEGLSAHLVRGVLGGLGLRVVGRGLGLVTSILLARLLGAEGYGVYTYALVLVALLLWADLPDRVRA